MVRDALVEAAVAKPAGAVDPAQYAWLGEVGGRVAQMWAARATGAKPAEAAGALGGATAAVPAAEEKPLKVKRCDDGWEGDSNEDDDWDNWGDDDGGKKATETVAAEPAAAAAVDVDADYDVAALKLEVRDRVDAFLERLGALAKARRGMKSAGALLGDGDGVPEAMLGELAGRIGAGVDDAGVGADLYHAVSSLGRAGTFTG
jgi:hypothetical protein